MKRSKKQRVQVWLTQGVASRSSLADQKTNPAHLSHIKTNSGSAHLASLSL